MTTTTTTDRQTCPECAGTGFVLTLRQGEKLCRVCSGRGSVTTERLRMWRVGRSFHDARVSLGLERMHFVDSSRGKWSLLDVAAWESGEAEIPLAAWRSVGGQP